jgi:hypothetical protein
MEQIFIEKLWNLISTFCPRFCTFSKRDFEICEKALKGGGKRYRKLKIVNEVRQEYKPSVQLKIVLSTVCPKKGPLVIHYCTARY